MSTSKHRTFEFQIHPSVPITHAVFLNPKRESSVCFPISNPYALHSYQEVNIAAGEWLRSGRLGRIEKSKVEAFHGDSRFDFAFEKDGKSFLEVKGVTLENDGVCAFPGAPTERSAKHLKGLAQLAQEGYGAYVLFVIQMVDANQPSVPPCDRQSKAVCRYWPWTAITADSMALRLPVLVKL